MTDRAPARPSLQTPRPAGASIGFSGESIDLDDCASAIRRGSKSFYLSSLLLPAKTRQAAYALYAFCRHSDDLVDRPGADQASLYRLRKRLDQIYAGTPGELACDRAFARTVEAASIPRIVPEALLDGFAMDLEGRRYQTLAEVKDYATRVASTVGIMMAMVMGTGNPHALARAADLGIAMQLTNIARDVGEDARNGRLYLPLDWLEQAGINAGAFLKNPVHSPALGEVVCRLLGEAARHYRLGHAGIAALAPDCRRAIRTAALVYEEIGTRIAANNFDSVSQRAFTPLTVKLGLLLTARRRGLSLARAGHLEARPDPAARLLVQAAAASFSPAHDHETMAGSTLDRFTAIMMNLHARSRQSEQFQRQSAREKVTGLV